MSKIPRFEIDMSKYSGWTYDQFLEEVMRLLIEHYNKYIVEAE